MNLDAIGITTYKQEIWDKRWMGIAEEVQSWSEDRSTKVGAVIVDKSNVLISTGWNGFPRGVLDKEERHSRPAKYLWTEHAERNAIYNSARRGHGTEGCKIYVPWYPCADCARAIIQAGIVEVIAREPDWNHPTYKDSFSVTTEMFEEARIRVRFYEDVP